MGALAVTQPLAMLSRQAPTSAIALELFERLDRLPHSYFVHLAHDNRNAPLICAGDVVVVDQGGMQQGGWYPTEGGLFLIEYRGGLTDYPGQRYPRVSREIVQTMRSNRGDWYASSLRRGGAVDGIFLCDDGPYRDEEALADRLIGRVVGILAAAMARAA